MNSVGLLLARLKTLGVRVEVRNGALRLDAARGVVTAPLLAELHVRRAELLDHLEAVASVRDRLIASGFVVVRSANLGDFPVLVVTSEDVRVPLRLSRLGWILARELHALLRSEIRPVDLRDLIRVRLAFGGELLSVRKEPAGADTGAVSDSGCRP